MKGIKDIDPDDYGLSVTEKHRKFLMSELQKGFVEGQPIIPLLNILKDLYEEVDSINREPEGEDN